MNFIAREAINPELGSILLAFGAIFMVVFVISFMLFGTKHDTHSYMFPIALVSVIVGGAGLIFGSANAADTTYAAEEAQLKSVQSEIEGSYNFALSDEELAELNYPEDKPTAKFQSFGSFEQTAKDDDGSFVKRELTLIWDDGDMILAQSENGEDFEPLELKR
jgi:hypothetical protein